MVTKETLTRIKARAKEMKIPDKVLFTSPEFYRYLKDKVRTTLQRDDVELRVTYNPSSTDTGCTQGSVIHINLANPLAMHYDAQESRVLANLGILFHECAHILYTDFDGLNFAIDSLGSGVFWPAPPFPQSADENSNLQEMKKYMAADKRVCKLLESVSFELHNCILDAHDEAAICADHGDFIRNAIEAQVISNRAQTAPLDSLVESMAPDLEIMYSLVLQYVRFYKVMLLDDEFENSEYMKALNRIKPLLYSARHCNSTQTRFDLVNRIILQLWPYIKASINNDSKKGGQGSQQQSSGGDQQNSGEQQNSGNGQSGSQNGQSSGSQGQSSSPNISDEGLKKAAEALSNAIKNAGLQNAGKAPTGCRTADTALPQNQPDTTQGYMSLPDTPDTSSLEGQLNTLKEKLCMEKAADEEEQVQSEELKDMVKGFTIPPTHKDRKLYINRHLKLNPSLVDLYKKEYAEVRVYSKSMQKDLKRIIEERQESRAIRKMGGKIIQYKEAYRPDQQFFFSKKLPDDVATISIALLIDSSGSMGSANINSSRIAMCRKAAILLEDFASGLGIPVMVASHHVTGKQSNYGCHLNIFVPFERATQKDKYRLMNMDGAGCNRDGLALSVVSQMLMPRKEDVKLLFLLSDGRPSDGPQGEEAAADLRKICEAAEKKGVEIIAAGIGDDRAILRNIYGSRYVDISDLSKLKKELIKRVRRRILY